MLSSAGIDPYSFQAYDTVLCPVHYLDCWFSTCTETYSCKTNSEDSVLDSTQCRMLGNYVSIPAELKIHVSVIYKTALSLN